MEKFADFMCVIMLILAWIAVILMVAGAVYVFGSEILGLWKAGWV